MNLHIHRTIPITEAEGPGKRFALWTQGCPIRCSGCFNPQTWSSEGGEVFTVEEMYERVRGVSEIEGVSLLGGEPLAQAGPLATLAERCKEGGLSVVTFTGYEYDHIVKANRPDWNALLATTDLLLAGPFIQSQRDFSRPWIGSRNQQFIFLSERYRHLQSQLNEIPNRLEVHVSKSSKITLNGLAPVEELRLFRAQLAELGLSLKA